ncbi:MAG: OB-fold domain-containing protein [Pseudomonadota bacterium]
MTTPYQARVFDAPQISAENAAYFEAAAQDRLIVKRCDACNAVHHFPRTICPFCGSDRTSWIDASGHGTVYSVSVTRRGTPAPYAMAYVTLAEGVTMMTNIVDCDLDAIRIGDAVVVSFVASKDGKKIPMFRPAAAAGRPA